MHVNVFKELNNTTPDISGMLRDKNEMINIAKTIKPFSIVFREAFLTKKLDSYPDIHRIKKQRQCCDRKAFCEHCLFGVCRA